MTRRQTHEKLELRLKQLECETNERLCAEDHLKSSELKYRTLFESSPDAILMLERGVYFDCNQRALEVFRFSSKEEFRNTSPRELSPPTLPDGQDTFTAMQQHVEHAYRNGTERFEWIHRRKDGTMFPSEVVLSKLSIGDRDVLQSLVRDITDRKEAEREVQESELKYRTLFESSPDAILMVDRMGLFDCNQAALAMFGCATKDEFIRNNLHSFSPSSQPDGENSGAAMRDHIEKALQNGSDSFEWIHQKKDGAPFPSEMSLSRLELSGRVVLQAIVRDITEKKKAEEALRESEARYRGVFDSATDAFMIISPMGRIVEVNQQASTMYGYSPEEFACLRVENLVHPDGYEDLQRHFQQLRSTGDLGAELLNKRKDGTPFNVEVRATLFNYKGERYALSVIRDVTERKRAEEERRKLQAQLQQAQKMEAIGTLAGGIAHDFNNLLTGIQGSISMMRLDVDTRHPHYPYLRDMEEIVKRGVNLTEQLLGFARGGKYEVRPADPNQLIKKTAEMFGRTRKEIIIHEQYRGGAWTVEVDRGQMEQVLLNLFVNAWQAMPEGGALVLRTENVTIDGDFAQLFRIQSGRYVRLSITDTGMGMDEETMRRIFDPFFTTKEVGKGTGLGLASAYNIVKNHGGLINVYSEKGRGSTFFVYLPASDKAIPREREKTREILRGTETVLLVDDEQMILDVGRKMLNSMDYKVLAARGGREALNVYRKNKDQIDIVVLDMIMPDINGGETYDRLKEINPNIKVILASGYSLDGQANKIMERGCNGFIQKPFDMKKLSRKIREVLDQTS